MLKLVDKPDLGSGAERRMGSIPFARTRGHLHRKMSLFLYHNWLNICPIYQRGAQRKIPVVRGPSEHWTVFINDPLSGKSGLQWPPAAHWCWFHTRWATGVQPDDDFPLNGFAETVRTGTRKCVSAEAAWLCMHWTEECKCLCTKVIGWITCSFCHRWFNL